MIPIEAIREGCCSTWPKPCSYHEGFIDGYHVREDEAPMSELANAIERERYAR